MRHQQTFRVVFAAAALSAGLTACTTQTSPISAPGAGTSPSTGVSPGAGIAPGEPNPQGSSQQSSGQPEENPGEGTGFGKCTSDTLSMRVEFHGDEDVAREADLFIANVGTRACNLAGFPELKFYDDGNQAVSIPSQPVGSTQSLLEIKPGERFSAPLGWSSSPESSPCIAPKTVGVTPPNTSDEKQIPWTGGSICAKGVGIHPYERP